MYSHLLKNDARNQLLTNPLILERNWSEITSKLQKLEPTLLENECIPCKDLARFLQKTYYLQDPTRECFP